MMILKAMGFNSWVIQKKVRKNKVHLQIQISKIEDRNKLIIHFLITKFLHKYLYSYKLNAANRLYSVSFSKETYF